MTAVCWVVSVASPMTSAYSSLHNRQENVSKTSDEVFLIAGFAHIFLSNYFHSTQKGYVIPLYPLPTTLKPSIMMWRVQMKQVT